MAPRRLSWLLHRTGLGWLLAHMATPTRRTYRRLTRGVGGT